VHQFTTERPPNQGTPLWEELLLWFGPALLLGGLLAWWWRNSGGSLGSLGMGGMGRSRARRYDSGSAKRTTFADVAGIEDVQNEVSCCGHRSRRRSATIRKARPPASSRGSRWPPSTAPSWPARPIAE
jgi:hypothetical protein